MATKEENNNIKIVWIMDMSSFVQLNVAIIFFLQNHQSVCTFDIFEFCWIGKTTIAAAVTAAVLAKQRRKQRLSTMT